MLEKTMQLNSFKFVLNIIRLYSNDEYHFKLLDIGVHLNSHDVAGRKGSSNFCCKFTVLRVLYCYSTPLQQFVLLTYRTKVL